MKKALYLACFLAIVSALAGGLLAAVNEVTAAKINANALAEVMGSLEKVFPGTTYAEITDYTDDSGLVTGVYQAEGQGYMFQVETSGFKDTIKFVLGIDNDSKIVGYDVIAIAETSGIGSRVAEDDFRNTVIGKTTGDKVDTLSGATISSTAVVKGLDAAKAVYASLTGNAAPAPSTPTTPEASKEPETPASTATVLDQKADGSQVTVTVEAKGFQGNNTYTVVIDSEKQEIVSVAMTTFNDTPGVGDAVNDEYLAGFAGLNSEDALNGVDVKSGATYTSNSAIDAVKAAWNAVFAEAGQDAADQPVIRPECRAAPQGHGVRGIEQQDGDNHRRDNAREHRGERRARDACVKAVDHCCIANYVDNINQSRDHHGNIGIALRAEQRRAGIIDR